MTTKNENHNWNNEDLVIAYYYAKWGTVNLGLDEAGLVTIIGETTKPSLLKQAANFRGALGIEGFTLTAKDNKICKSKSKVIDALQNKTITQVRNMVLITIEERQDRLEAKYVKDTNKEANKRRDEMNAESQTNFENKLELYKNMGRNLTPVKK